MLSIIPFYAILSQEKVEGTMEYKLFDDYITLQALFKELKHYS